ncbi:hypothetical protein [Okeania sp.]|uniref:hypothetical protein n=1 Tax=Okeania sp. TaxID=3100323 RepID=UPI002B4ACA9A|nr:hypothetical protein [Okeania sp.]MEB3342073.1 hypothetical protein [Okeania sp.]
MKTIQNTRQSQFKIRLFPLVGLFVCFWALFCVTSPVSASSISQPQLEDINQLWRGSAHALADINCSSCHLEEKTKKLISQPTYESCQSCHESEVETFLFGKHGIRLGEGLSPLTPKMASLPMKESALGRQMNCNTCHDVHSVNTYQAAVDSCLTCHNDTHSLSYQDSKHGQQFLAAGRLPRPSEESVTCASCHLPRQHQEIGKKVFVNHNNTYNLLPRDRMVADVCMNCHGMEYSYNSIFDNELVEGNFNRQPNQDLETLKLIREFEKKRLGN